MSLKKLNRSANLHSGILSKANINKNGTSPRTKNKKTPGRRKLVKGDSSNIDKGIPTNAPEGEMINVSPPPIAPKPRNPNKKRKIIHIILVLMPCLYVNINFY